jgi:hypothetical protein
VGANDHETLEASCSGGYALLGLHGVLHCRWAYRIVAGSAVRTACMLHYRMQVTNALFLSSCVSGLQTLWAGLGTTSPDISKIAAAGCNSPAAAGLKDLNYDSCCV